MAMTRLTLWQRLLVAILLAITFGCGGGSRARHHHSHTSIQNVDLRRSGADALLVLMPDSPHTRQAWEAMRDELQGSFSILARVVSNDTTAEEVEQQIDASLARGVVLMGNLPMNLYLKVQARRGNRPMPPAVVVMASFFDEQRALFHNATGIAYEIPGITTFVGLRSFVYNKMQRVGVVHRPLFKNYVEKQRKLARVEQVELVPAEVSQDPGPYELRRAVERLVNYEKVDAIWVLNDNVLLEPELIAHAWLYILRKSPTLVVVGVGSLVDTRLHFGSFAMLPDHAGLGVQTANLIFKLAEEGWDANSQPTELPISVQTVVDLPWTQAHFDVREDALERIDRILR